MPDALYVVKLNWIAQPFGIFALGLGKVAIALLIIRLLERASVWRKWILYVTSAWTMINTILMCLFTFVQCQDPRALWEPEVKAKTKCWNPSSQSDFSIYGSSAFCLMDFLLAFMPITLVYRLQLNLRKKVGLCLLLGCGSLTGICAAIKTSKLVSLASRSDLTWGTYELYIWTGLEIVLLIICGSIPTLKPLYAMVKSEKLRFPSKSIQDLSDNSRSFPRPRSTYVKQMDSEIEHSVGSPCSPLGSIKRGVGSTYVDSSPTARVATNESIHVTQTFEAVWQDSERSLGRHNDLNQVV
ncbi:hypothetical protein AOQ84DRAFT_441419 [Glonium stellatum]|uniref:Rhodopsin domain-containing protein n=1 Tax=Glonium stellatum TaxID=574774 RepID=A0A8E2EVB5_9PEZI|nr:hypothetical protein AOQ84DRAFT_441419 [Glonium stellatum]